MNFISSLFSFDSFQQRIESCAILFMFLKQIVTPELSTQRAPHGCFQAPDRIKKQPPGSEVKPVIDHPHREEETGPVLLQFCLKLGIIFFWISACCPPPPPASIFFIWNKLEN